MAITKGSSPTPTAGGVSQDLLNSLQQFAQVSGSGGTQDTGPVWMPSSLLGLSTSRILASEPAGAQARQRPAGSQGGWFSQDDALNAYFNWSQKQRDDFRAKGLLSGLLTQGAGDLEAFSLWQNLVQQAGRYGAQKQEVGPLDILAGYVKGNGNGWVKSSDGRFEVNPITGERRYIGPKFKTTSQTQVDLTDPATARAVATKVFQDLLGRDPNSGEIAAYAGALSQSEQQNPSTQVTTTQFGPDGEPVNTNTINSGGISAEGQQQLAEDQIKKTKEYGVTQAATTYFNALEQAVGV